MAKDKGGKGRGNNGIRNGHLIGQGGGEIKKKPGKTFAEQAKAAKPNTGKSQVEKVGGKKQENQKWADKIKPKVVTQTKPKPNPHKKPSLPTKSVAVKNPQAPSKKPTAPALAKPVLPKTTIAEKAPTVTKPTPKVVTSKKAPAKSAVAKVKAAAKQIAPKKPTPPKVRKVPSKGR